uniref:Uncharacterized protein n=1 Tax=Timema cristinae TaxID=61476 RepID=A0A7R9CPD3_TIMCR|nr:unnamed protein product [Timema cristinae]
MAMATRIELVNRREMLNRNNMLPPLARLSTKVMRRLRANLQENSSPVHSLGQDGRTHQRDAKPGRRKYVSTKVQQRLPNAIISYLKSWGGKDTPDNEAEYGDEELTEEPMKDTQMESAPCTAETPQDDDSNEFFETRLVAVPDPGRLVRCVENPSPLTFATTSNVDAISRVNKFIREVKSHDNDSVLKQQTSPFIDNPAWHNCQVRCSMSGNSRTADVTLGLDLWWCSLGEKHGSKGFQTLLYYLRRSCQTRKALGSPMTLHEWQKQQLLFEGGLTLHITAKRYEVPFGMLCKLYKKATDAKGGVGRKLELSYKDEPKDLAQYLKVCALHGEVLFYDTGQMNRSFRHKNFYDDIAKMYKDENIGPEDGGLFI